MSVLLSYTFWKHYKQDQRETDSLARLWLFTRSSEKQDLSQSSLRTDRHYCVHYESKRRETQLVIILSFLLESDKYPRKIICGYKDERKHPVGEI